MVDDQVIGNTADQARPALHPAAWLENIINPIDGFIFHPDGFQGSLGDIFRLCGDRCQRIS
jgi:hypothetical protein